MQPVVGGHSLAQSDVGVVNADYCAPGQGPAALKMSSKTGDGKWLWYSSLWYSGLPQFPRHTSFALSHSLDSNVSRYRFQEYFDTLLYFS